MRTLPQPQFFGVSCRVERNSLPSMVPVQYGVSGFRPSYAVNVVLRDKCFVNAYIDP